MNAEIVIWETFPRWVLMWLLAGGVFLAGKLAARASVEGPATWGREAAWLTLWPGMDARAFFQRRAAQGVAQPAALYIANLLLGGILMWGVARCLPHPLAAGWAGMMGLVLVLHFGAFGLLAVLWRRAGVPVSPIMDRPAAAVSVAEFWGRRWNRAFRDLAHPFVFRPVLRRLGPAAASWTTFLVSGLVHELVITVPAGAGYGLPTLYFLIQAAGAGMERQLFQRRNGMECRGLHRLFTVLVTAGPACVLFPPAFVERVMIPFLQYIHALP
jgi:alginate O-acetyltransferase complex protein AlgI